MRVIWTPEAQQDRADVWDYIAADNPRAAVRMDELFSLVQIRVGVNKPDQGVGSGIWRWMLQLWQN